MPAFATTIHKSQGSEYPAVVIPIVTQHFTMLARNLLYTGVTRGKQLVVLIGQRKAIAHGGARRPAAADAGRSCGSGSRPKCAGDDDALGRQALRPAFLGLRLHAEERPHRAEIRERHELRPQRRRQSLEA